MFYRIEQFPYLQKIREHCSLISREFETAVGALPELNDFMQKKLPETYSHIDYWIRETGIDEETVGYDSRKGIWGAFPLFKEGFPIKWYDVNVHFPRSISLVSGVDKVYFSSFMRLGPGSGTAAHAHKLSHLIFHLALFDNPGGSELTCGTQTAYFEKQGDYCIFDYSNLHSSQNHGTLDRIHLTVDFRCEKPRELLLPMQERVQGI